MGGIFQRVVADFWTFSQIGLERQRWSRLGSYRSKNLHGYEQDGTFCFNVCFAPPDVNVLGFKITGQFWSVIRVFEQHFNVQLLGGGAFVDLRFQFQEGVDFKKWFEKLQHFEGVAKQGATFWKGIQTPVFTMFT